MLLGANLLFAEKKGGLPYDAEVEYLQGDGVAYIELDDRYAEYIKRAGISKGTSNTAEYFSGSFSGRHIHAFGSRADSVIICESYRTTYEASYVADGFAIYDLVADGTNFVISKDGVELASTPCTTKVPLAYSGHNLALFASKYYSTTEEITSIFTGRCSYFKVEDDNSLILDLIPVRKGSVGYMYDRVSGKLYGNAAGTGAFIVGPDKGLPYDAEVEWLQGDGVAYIDGFIDFGDETCKTLKIDASVTVADGAYDYDNIDEYPKSMFAVITRKSLTSSNLMVSVPTLDEGGDLFSIRNFATGKSVKADLDENPVTITFYKDSDTLSVMNVIKNGVTVKTDNRTSFTSYGTYSGYTPILFGVKTETGAIEGLTKGKLIAFKCKNLNTGEEVDMIPVRKDGVGYMYDKISGQLFGNAADSGAFIVGPDK